ncbi:alpha-1,2-mannosidase, putative [Granulicella rosea]|uniref:Alpha-1,2-mannosidase, putative n=1 Tax=Granulicella rosea TaxID=474952 RepID=A0A239EC27_9BACT|nr:GH92 family glycosyl hydrolase [Granulicella rosea]SNS42225.1 alpha-1,2-mannosidase, putative [Granulicella rosea]
MKLPLLNVSGRSLLLTGMIFSFAAGQVFAQQLTQYVNVFAGTQGDHGQTTPAASLPFGMAIIGPDTYPAIHGDFHNGYNYTDKKIVGFSHFRMSGVGCSGEGGNLSMLPLSSPPQSSNPDNYAQEYIKDAEQGAPDFYAVTFASRIRAEMTATRHASIEKYVFPEGGTSSILVNLTTGRTKILSAEIHQVSPTRLEGKIRAGMLCNVDGYYDIYFDLETQAPILSVDDLRPDHPATVVNLKFAPSTTLVSTKVGFSTISTADAASVLKREILAWDFEKVRAAGNDAWNQELSRITIHASPAETHLFYTTYYHTLLLPMLVADIGETYRGTDSEVHTAKSHRYYSGWSLWDTYRTQMPLLTLLSDERARDLCGSLTDVFRQRYAEQATGYWPVPEIRQEGAEQYLLDSARKGICPNLDATTYKFVRDQLLTRIHSRRGTLDYVPYTPKRPGTVATTLVDDYVAWALSGLAMQQSENADAKMFAKIAASYPVLWDKEVSQFAGKDAEGNWHVIKDPDVDDDTVFYEGSARQYRWAVPYDMPGLIHLMGGADNFTRDLNDLFTTHHFNMANEPDLEYPYLFVYSGAPWLTQKYVHDFATKPQVQIYASHGYYPKPVFEVAFKDTPAALLPEMDDDAGAMSSWYVLSAIGLYQPLIGEPYYIVTTPVIAHTKLHLSGGKIFSIDVTQGDPATDTYIQSAALNGKPLDRAWVHDNEVRAGGKLTLILGSQPNKQWGLEPPPQ